MADHPGQIAFPGGRLAPGESAAAAALREAEEELGVPSAAVELLGELTTVWIPVSRFEVRPFLGWMSHEPAWRPDPREVARLLLAPAEDLARSGPTARYRREWEGREFAVPAFKVGGRLVWGATALVLAEFSQIWLRLTEGHR